MPSRKKASKNHVDVSKASSVPPQEQEYVTFPSGASFFLILLSSFSFSDFGLDFLTCGG
jgi:hypothetical protein